MKKYDLENMTGAGCLLTLITAVITLAIGIPLTGAIARGLPAGRYPRLIFVLPILGVGLVVYAIGAGVARAMGKPLFQSNDPAKPREDGPPLPPKDPRPSEVQRGKPASSAGDFNVNGLTNVPPEKEAASAGRFDAIARTAFVHDRKDLCDSLVLEPESPVAQDELAYIAQRRLGGHAATGKPIMQSERKCHKCGNPIPEDARQDVLS